MGDNLFFNYFLGTQNLSGTWRLIYPKGSILKIEGETKLKKYSNLLIHRRDDLTISLLYFKSLGELMWIEIYLLFT